MIVKDVINSFQINFDFAEDNWYYFYTKDDLNDYDVKATDKEWVVFPYENIEIEKEECNKHGEINEK